MKFTAAAVLAIAAGASAFENVTYTTEVVTAVTTFCPAATEITHAGTTYTITEATTLTITDCPCTITKPVTTVASVACVTCAAPSSSAPVYTNGTGSYPTTGVAPSLPAGTGGVPVGGGSTGGAGGSTPTTSTGSSASSSSSSTPPVVTAGAGKAAVVSGAGLAGFLGLAAFLL
ncbi:hypothetical protein VPNG_05461 [Cytospora leucostoma]|uniref:Clock-controlled protein 6 n=1 Tax=Cytospora leucostoma TaxID=1230097 RepID=A0A423XBP5_9PEZI|nr:hypothetical protein VPNG_05461 [Cytospora leucostoma]